MKAMTSHDGKMHGNAQVVERYDESTGKGKPKARGGESGGAHEDSGHDEIKGIVGEHGPATSYSISTTHEDGHVHTAHHESHDMAREHLAHAGGVSDSGDLNESHGGMQEEDTTERASMRGGIEERPNADHLGGGFMPEHHPDDRMKRRR